MTTRQHSLFYLTLLIITFQLPLIGQVQKPIANPDKITVNKIIEISYENPDSSIQLLESRYYHLLNDNDTISAINILNQLSQIHGHQANYKASYDYIWKALFLADKINNNVVKVDIYNYLGNYYSFFKRQEDAFRYYNTSLNIAKQLVPDGKIDDHTLARNYYTIGAAYRGLDIPAKAKLYIDSCYQIYSPTNTDLEIPYLEMEVAYIKNSEKKFNEAISIYNKIIPWFQVNQPSYLVLVHTYTGDVYFNLKDFIKSEEHYKKALDISERYNSHIDFTPLIYERLSELYHREGRLSESYNSLSMAKSLDKKFFDSRSENNRPLLEIQDAYRLEQERLENLLQEKRIIELENKTKISFLQRIILFVSIFFLIVIGIVYINYVRSKYKAEKKLLKKKKELEIQKANELLEIKNKELATSTLKLIEKDEILTSLKERLSKEKEGLNENHVRQIARSIKVDNSQNWEEFESRFISVNSSFYEKLHEKFPKLTQGEQRLCALIKLNFSSKDMAKLMGISVESVHTSRYRLRKKFSLPRDVNLPQFIGDI